MVTLELCFYEKTFLDLPETSPGEGAVRPMFESRWSILGTGWDCTVLSCSAVVCSRTWRKKTQFGQKTESKEKISDGAHKNKEAQVYIYLKLRLINGPVCWISSMRLWGCTLHPSETPQLIFKCAREPLMTVKHIKKSFCLFCPSQATVETWKYIKATVGKTCFLLN